MEVTEQLSEFVSQTQYSSLPQIVVKEAKRIILESIANILFGSASGLGRTMAKVLLMEESPGAVCINTGKRCSLRTAAFYNTAVADTVDSVGGSYKTIIHPGKNLVPASLTVASALEKNGKDLILAIVLGNECCFRMDIVIGGPIKVKGAYVDGVLASLGSVISVGKLFGLHKDDLTGAIGIGGMLAPTTLGGASMFKSAARPLAMGQQSANAILAVQMQLAGVRGPSDILERPVGGFGQALAGTADLSKITEDLGKVWECLVCYKKPFVGCGLTHLARQGTEVLKKKHNIKVDNIEAVTVGVQKGSLMVTSHHARTGANIVEHSCCGPYLIANVLMYDDTGPGCLTEERMNDPKVHELADKVEVVEDPELTKLAELDSSLKLLAKLQIVMKSGEKYSYSNKHIKWYPFDRDATTDGWAATDAEIEDKFRLYASGILSLQKTEDVIAIISQLEDLDNVAKLMNLLL